MGGEEDPLAVLAAAEGYLEAQEAVGERLRDGFWALAKARLRVGQAWAGPEYCREGLGAARRVVAPMGSSGSWRLVAADEVQQQQQQQLEDGEPTPCQLDDLAVILAGGLTPSELREAQKHFRLALEGVVRLAAAAASLLQQPGD